MPYRPTLLNPGDQFYLINSGTSGQLANNPADDYAVSRQGFTTRYNFIIDKDASNNPATTDATRWLMARLPLIAHPSNGLPPIQAAPEAKALLEGRAASLGFLGMGGGWLADHSYQQADMAFEFNKEDLAWAPFAGFDYAYKRFNSGSEISVTGLNLAVGLAARNKGPSGSLLLAAFAEVGYADYETNNSFAHAPEIKGDGIIHSIGGGLMARG
jgi:hypothetical protein